MKGLGAGDLSCHLLAQFVDERGKVGNEVEQPLVDWADVEKEILRAWEWREPTDASMTAKVKCRLNGRQHRQTYICTPRRGCELQRGGR